MTFKAIVRKGEDGWYVVSVPSLPGCHSQGKTFEEAMKNIEEAVRAYIKVCKKFGDSFLTDDENVYEATLRLSDLVSPFFPKQRYAA